MKAFFRLSAMVLLFVVSFVSCKDSDNNDSETPKKEENKNEDKPTNSYASASEVKDLLCSKVWSMGDNDIYAYELAREDESNYYLNCYYSHKSSYNGKLSYYVDNAVLRKTTPLMLMDEYDALLSEETAAYKYSPFKSIGWYLEEFCQHNLSEELYCSFRNGYILNDVKDFEIKTTYVIDYGGGDIFSMLKPLAKEKLGIDIMLPDAPKLANYLCSIGILYYLGDKDADYVYLGGIFKSEFSYRVAVRISDGRMMYLCSGDTESADEQAAIKNAVKKVSLQGKDYYVLGNVEDWEDDFFSPRMEKDSEGEFVRNIVEERKLSARFYIDRAELIAKCKANKNGLMDKTSLKNPHICPLDQKSSLLSIRHSICLPSYTLF